MTLKRGIDTSATLGLKITEWIEFKVAQKKTMLFPLLALFIAGPLLVHETLRLVDLQGQCTQRWIENALLIQNGICSDPRQRHAHGAKMEQTCREAEQENTVTPWACAFREMWRQGGLYRLWDAVVGSPWMLFGLAGVALLFCFQALQYRAQRTLQERMYRETLAMVHAPQLPAPAPAPIQFIMPSAWLQGGSGGSGAVDDYNYGRDRGRIQRSRVDL
jgi:hypothetical protein